MEKNVFEVIDKLTKKCITKQKTRNDFKLFHKIYRKNKGISGFMHGNCNKKSNKVTKKM